MSPCSFSSSAQACQGGGVFGVGLAGLLEEAAGFVYPSLLFFQQRPGLPGRGVFGVGLAGLLEEAAGFVYPSLLFFQQRPGLPGRGVFGVGLAGLLEEAAGFGDVPLLFFQQRPGLEGGGVFGVGLPGLLEEAAGFGDASLVFEGQGEQGCQFALFGAWVGAEHPTQGGKQVLIQVAFFGQAAAGQQAQGAFGDPGVTGGEAPGLLFGDLGQFAAQGREQARGQFGFRAGQELR
jgi:hypothetical protein